MNKNIHIPESNSATSTQIDATQTGSTLILPIIGAVAFAHLLNDSIQAIVTASYPMLKAEFSLSFTQIGWIAMIYQLTASLLQPWIGLYTDKHPKPYLLPMGMVMTFMGIGLMSVAPSFNVLLVSAAMIGVVLLLFIQRHHALHAWRRVGNLEQHNRLFKWVATQVLPSALYWPQPSSFHMANTQ